MLVFNLYNQYLFHMILPYVWITTDQSVKVLFCRNADGIWMYLKTYAINSSLQVGYS